jgi:hypothetical protein
MCRRRCSLPLTRLLIRAMFAATAQVGFWPKVDLPKNAIDVAFGVKRTSAFAVHMSAFDPKTGAIQPPLLLTSRDGGASSPRPKHQPTLNL